MMGSTHMYNKLDLCRLNTVDFKKMTARDWTKII
jgi:hypothetical protein